MVRHPGPIMIGMVTLTYSSPAPPMAEGPIAHLMRNDGVNTFIDVTGSNALWQLGAQQLPGEIMIMMAIPTC